MRTSSSSSDEDLSLFQAVAVSAEDLAESARKEVEKAEARRRSRNTGRSTQQQPPAGGNAAAASPAAGASRDSRPAPPQDLPGQDDNCELDITSKRIAAALDSILARQLDHAAPPATQQQQPAATATAQAAATDNDTDDTAAAAGVRLFRRVAAGTPCVIRNTEYGSSASLLNTMQTPGAADPTAAHLHPAFAGQSRPFRSIKEAIPRFGLAAASSDSSKKRHSEVLQMLTVDGPALIAAAAGAGTSWTHLQQLQQQQQEQQEQQQQQQGEGSSKKKKKKKTGLATHAQLEAWKHMRRNKVDGLVVEAKQYVDHDERIAKLLGQVPAASTAVSN